MTAPIDTRHPEIVNADGDGEVLILCDHASNRIPEPLGTLGLQPRLLDDHIAWDIGAADVARGLSASLDAPAVLATVSRLVIDLNREPDSPTLIPAASDGTPIPGNQGLSDAERGNRIQAIHAPYHRACADVLQRMLAAGKRPVVIAMHSFTPVMDGQARPWEIGFLYDRDPRLFHAFRHVLLARHELTIGDNEPYSGEELYHTMREHGEAHGLPQTTVEVRQDLIGDADGVRRWTDILATALRDIAADPTLLGERTAPAT